MTNAYSEAFSYDQSQKYLDKFYELMSDGEIYADPSGWLDTRSLAADEMPLVEIKREALDRYYLDEGDALGPIKDKIVRIVTAWEDAPIDADNITLYSSVSVATLAILVTLKRKGIKRIVFETPAYGVTINQARHLGLTVDLIPTYYRDSFKADFSQVAGKDPCALWLTQPRMAIGTNQDLFLMQEIVDGLAPKDYIVVDEATEQYFPSHLSTIIEAESRNTIRVRGFLKGAGLNGIRLSFVLHDKSFRKDLEGAQEVLGASLDIYSLAACATLSDDIGKLKSILGTANRQVAELRNHLERVLYGEEMIPSPIVNGYMGSIRLSKRGHHVNPNSFRRQILELCREKRLPVLLGPSMFFANDPDWEFMRVNYFKRKQQVVRGVLKIRDFYREVIGS